MGRGLRGPGGDVGNRSLDVCRENGEGQLLGLALPDTWKKIRYGSVAGPKVSIVVQPPLFQAKALPLHERGLIELEEIAPYIQIVFRREAGQVPLILLDNLLGIDASRVRHKKASSDKNLSGEALSALP